MTIDEDYLRDRAAFVESANEAEAAGDGRTSALARQAYLAILPERTISRSPLTDELVRFRFDDVDLDGPWWDAYEPVRDEPHGGLPDGVISFVGAMELREPLAAAPFLVAPGPGVPYVHPELLELDGVVAVVSAIPVGHHTGYPILYFASAVPDGAPLLDWWGARDYEYVCGGEEHEGEYPAYEGDWDFGLRPWLEREKLLWIAPGDDGFTLRRGVASCPFVDLPGERGQARIKDGKLRRPDPD